MPIAASSVSLTIGVTVISRWGLKAATGWAVWRLNQARASNSPALAMLGVWPQDCIWVSITFEVICVRKMPIKMVLTIMVMASIAQTRAIPLLLAPLEIFRLASDKIYLFECSLEYRCLLQRSPFGVDLSLTGSTIEIRISTPSILMEL